MKCRDCPIFELSKVFNYEPPEWEQDMIRKYGASGVCLLYLAPKREQDEASCDNLDEMKNQIKVFEHKISLIRKVIDFVRSRRRS